jgi:hypothetical protein
MAMTDTPGVSDSPAKPLQFDHVEYAAPGPRAACKACGQPMQGVYYEVNGLPFCEGCRQQLQQSLSGGSAIGRFARATLYGLLAGLAGAAIYYGVREATNSEFGLISIVVGLMVGKAVKKGSNGRGGWFYQGLAMFLTYTAIVSTYIPPVIQAIRNRADEEAVAANAEPAAKPIDAAQSRAVADAPEAAGATAVADAAAAPAVAEAPGAAGEPETAAGVGVADAGPEVHVRPPLVSLVGQLVVVLGFLIGFAYALPVLVGLESPMGLIIVAIGLYEAWTINRRAAIVINGPYQIARADTGSGVHVEPGS